MKTTTPVLLQTTFDLSETHHKDMWRNTRERYKKSRLYLTVNPNPQKQKTIEEVFSERFYSPKTGITRQIKRALIQELNSKFVVNGSNSCTEEDISLRWDKYAGCSCPCSPGYVITFNNWVNIPSYISRGGNFRVSIEI